MYKLFSVEDDKDLQDLLKFSLTGFGYETAVFERAEDMFSVLEGGKLPDLVLLDIMLPGMDGIDALKTLKADPRYRAIPVILLTAKNTELNIVSGLNQGADDYMAKPFSVMELSARINAQLRKSGAAGKIEVPGITLDTASREAYIDGKPVKVTAKEFEILSILLKSPGVVQKRDDLLTTIWGYAYFGETRTLDMHIRTVRAKLGRYAENLVTVRGLGFKYKV